MTDMDRADGYYVCDDQHLFELGSVAHKHYLLNIKFPVTSENNRECLVTSTSFFDGVHLTVSKKKMFLFKENIQYEISLNFPDLFIIGKYVKIRFKNRSHHAIFWVLEVKRSKTLQKLNKRDFLFTFLVSFFMAFLAQKLVYTINIWFNFVFGSFFEQDHLLNLFILGVYAKRWPKCARISIQKLM